MQGFMLPEWGGVFIPDQSLLESFLRGSVVYLAILVLFRVMLKRQAGSLGLPDILLAVLVSESVSASLSAEAKSVPNGLVAAGALLFWTYVLDRLGHRWPWFQRLLEPQPVELIRNGKLLRENMDREGITEDELKAQLREHGIDDPKRVKTSILESEGNVSVIPKESTAGTPVPTAAGESIHAETIQQLVSAVSELRAIMTRHQQQPAEPGAPAKAARKVRTRRGGRAKSAAESPNPKHPPEAHR